MYKSVRATDLLALMKTKELIAFKHMLHFSQGGGVSLKDACI